MGILFIILAIIGGAVCLLLLIALFSRKSYTVKRSISISKPVDEVFNYIKYLKNQDHFNKWVMMDPDMKKSFAGIDGSSGFIYAWDGNRKAGAGEQEIKRIEEGKEIDLEVRFTRPFKGLAHARLETGSVVARDPMPPATNVNWTFSSSMKYPANVFLLFMNIEKFLGRDLEISLANLKTVLENKHP